MPFLILLLVQGLIFLILALLLRYLLTRNISSASSHLHALTDECEKKLAEAEKKKQEADKYHEEILQRAKEAGEQTKRTLIKEGRDERDGIVKQAEGESTEITLRAQRAAEALREDLEQKIESEASRMACELVQQLLPGRLSEETHARWLQELMQNGLDGLNRLNLPAGINEVEVHSAFPLKPKETQMIQDRLKEKLGKAVLLKEKVEPLLILGMRLVIGTIVLDGTLRAKIEEILRHASNTTS